MLAHLLSSDLIVPFYICNAIYEKINIPLPLLVAKDTANGHMIKPFSLYYSTYSSGFVAAIAIKINHSI